MKRGTTLNRGITFSRGSDRDLGSPLKVYNPRHEARNQYRKSKDFTLSPTKQIDSMNSTGEMVFKNTALGTKLP